MGQKLPDGWGVPTPANQLTVPKTRARYASLTAHRPMGDMVIAPNLIRQPVPRAGLRMKYHRTAINLGEDPCK